MNELSRVISGAAGHYQNLAEILLDLSREDFGKSRWTIVGRFYTKRHNPNQLSGQAAYAFRAVDQRFPSEEKEGGFWHMNRVLPESAYFLYGDTKKSRFPVKGAAFAPNPTRCWGWVPGTG
jgi:hypothetical protein